MTNLEGKDRELETIVSQLMTIQTKGGRPVLDRYFNDLRKGYLDEIGNLGPTERGVSIERLARLDKAFEILKAGRQTVEEAKQEYRPPKELSGIIAALREPESEKPQRSHEYLPPRMIYQTLAVLGMLAGLAAFNAFFPKQYGQVSEKVKSTYSDARYILKFL